MHVTWSTATSANELFVCCLFYGKDSNLLNQRKAIQLNGANKYDNMIRQYGLKNLV